MVKESGLWKTEFESAWGVLFIFGGLFFENHIKFLTKIEIFFRLFDIYTSYGLLIKVPFKIK